MDGNRPLPTICADLDSLHEELKKLHEAARNRTRTAQDQTGLRPDSQMVIRGK